MIPPHVRDHLERHRAERLRKAWADLPPDPRSLEPDVEPLADGMRLARGASR